MPLEKPYLKMLTRVSLQPIPSLNIFQRPEDPDFFLLPIYAACLQPTNLPYANCCFLTASFTSPTAALPLTSLLPSSSGFSPISSIALIYHALFVFFRITSYLYYYVSY